MEVVYALGTAIVGQSQVVRGQIWPADDPVVKMVPTLFTKDPRPLLTFSVVPKVEEEPTHKRGRLAASA